MNDTAKERDLINESALRRKIAAVCAEWQIHRQALPKGSIKQLKADLDTAATRLVLAIITPLKSPPETAAVRPVPLS